LLPAHPTGVFPICILCKCKVCVWGFAFGDTAPWFYLGAVPPPFFAE
jgi:hypothetical protein